MSLLNRVCFSLLALLIFSGTVYYSGCASAESTTGKLAFQQQDYKKAEVELKKGLQVDQNDDEGWYMLGYSQIELGKYDEARQSFKKCLSIDSTFGGQIKSYWVEKYNAGALEFQSGLDLENKNDSANSRSYYQNALKNFEASAAIIPDSLKSMSAIGQTYLALGENDKALNILNEIAAKSKNPYDAERVAKVLFESGLTLMQANNYPPAIATFKKIISLPSLPKNNPYYETSTFNIGLALAKTGEDMVIKDENSNYKEKFTESLSYLEPIANNSKNNDLVYKSYDILIKVYSYLGMNDKAEDALSKKDSLKNDNK